MNEQDLDRIIDSATADLIGRRADRTLRHKVMARVRASEPTAPRRFVWATAGLAAAVCVVIALADDAEDAAAVGSEQCTGSGRTPSLSLAALRRMIKPFLHSSRHRRPRCLSQGAAAPRSVAANDRCPPLRRSQRNRLVLPSIDLSPIENHAASVEGLEIEALTIEPLTASND